MEALPGVSIIIFFFLLIFIPALFFTALWSSIHCMFWDMNPSNAPPLADRIQNGPCVYFKHFKLL